MTDIRIRIGKTILTRAEYLRQQEPGTDHSTVRDILCEQRKPHAPIHVGHVMQPKHPTGVISTTIIECRRNYMARVREELLDYLLRNRHEFHTNKELRAALSKKGVKVSDSGITLELSYIRHALEPQGVFGMTTKGPRKAMAYKYTGVITHETDIPGLVQNYLTEVDKAAKIVRSMTLEKRAVSKGKTLSQPLNPIAPAAQVQEQEVIQTVRLKLLVDVQFSIKLKED